MVALGDAFFWGEDRKHLWVVISAPEGARSEFIIVNLTTLDERIVDESCILKPNDYPEFVVHDTAVFYIDAKLWWRIGANGYDAIAFAGKVNRMTGPKAATLLHIQQGALKSDSFPPDYKPLVQDSLVVLPAPPARARGGAPTAPPSRRPI